MSHAYAEEHRLEHARITTNGIQLHVVQAGPQNGPLVILLHGFPEFWYGWRRQIQPLASAGYRVWIPDQRGYNLSDKPRKIAEYRLDALAADVVGLIDAAGRDKAFVVGHDWGAAVTWYMAARHPHRLSGVVILNAPHPSVFQHHLKSSFTQLRKSWYMFAFQIPRLPELRIARNNWRAGLRALVGSSQPGAFNASDLELYRQAWSQPGAITGMLNWYRAAMQLPTAPLANPRISVPTLILWGAQDQFLEMEMAQPSVEMCDDGQLFFIEEATHWVQHEQAGRVNRKILEFLHDRYSK